MRDTEADIAEALSNEGWLTVLDGPLHGIRHRRWELTAGERSGLFAMEDALYGCYLRVGDPGPWAGGHRPPRDAVRHRRDAAVEAADQAAGWLPGFASALHRDARAPVNSDADRRPRTASAPAAGGRTARPARGA